MEHQYVQGKDAKPPFTATSDWDEEPFVKRYPIFRFGPSKARAWPGMEAATAQLDEDHRRGAGDFSWMHPGRSVEPEAWRPWKYELDDREYDPRWEVICWDGPDYE
jgi:hypothetical protein